LEYVWHGHGEAANVRTSFERGEFRFEHAGDCAYAMKFIVSLSMRPSLSATAQPLPVDAARVRLLDIETRCKDHRVPAAERHDYDRRAQRRVTDFTFPAGGCMIRGTLGGKGRRATRNSPRGAGHTSILTSVDMRQPPIPSDNVTAEGESYPSAPQRLQFVDVEPPGAGEAVEIAPGIKWCRIPLPIDLNHINVWLIDHADGCIVVDTGMAAPVAEEAWERIAAEHFAAQPLLGVFVTHIHPDHIGLARWLQQRYRVPVWMSRRTHEQVQAFVSGDANGAEREAERFFASQGVVDRSLLPSLSPARFVRMTSGMPDDIRYVADCESLSWGGQQWRAMETNGHAEGHLCLFEASHRLLISGDQVLPTISSNIGFTWRNRDKDPLASFLGSLQRLRTLPSDTLVLPSHGVPFRGLQSRIDDLSSHHFEQLDTVTRACAHGRTAYEILPIMFRRPLSGMHFMLAMAEAVAHLEYLVGVARLQRRFDETGLVRYHAIA